MKIRRIEIIGFKSFVDKTVLEFPDGVTAVVGPNGCGKSNVVDAIRWVMGEQSAKNLRGRAMEDIIFAGSESRRSLGMAEVSLVFSTEDGRVPAKYLDYTEIQVTRRLYRDGESEYYLNKTPCRLMDINELFMDTGVGARAYSIIEQGRIGMILMAKPEDRRFLIEEAAGVTKYKSRKQVALKKIEATRQNLLRIGDIVSEIRRQLASLQRQAKKAERFKALRDELRSIEVSFATRQFQELAASIEQLHKQRGENSGELESLAGRLSEGEISLETMRISMLDEERALSASQEEIFRIKAQSQGLSGRLDFQRRELENSQLQRIRSAEELASLTARRVEALNEANYLQEQFGALLVEEKEQEEQLYSRTAGVEILQSSEAELTRRQEAVRQEMIGILNRLAQLNNRYGEADRRIARLSERMERSAREGAELSDMLAVSRKGLAELTASCCAAGDLKSELAKAVEISVVQFNQLRGSLQAVEETLQSVRDELGGARSWLISLTDLEAQLAGYGQGVRSIMTCDNFKGRFIGLVADLVETAPEFEVAVEALLGERLQYVACRDRQDAVAAIQHLGSVSGGRCSFVAPGCDASWKGNAPEGVPRIIDLVRISPEHRGVVEPLLAGACLASDLSSALELARVHPDLSFVTASGEVAVLGGVVTGGAIEGSGGGFIHARREIRELTATVAALSEKAAALDADRTRLKGEVAAADETLRSTRQQLHQTEMRLLALEKDTQRNGEELQRLEERRELIILEDARFAEEKRSIEQEKNEAATGRESLEQDKNQRDKELSAMQEELATRRRELAAEREAMTTVKVSVATIQEKREANRLSVQRVQVLLADIDKRIALLQEELDKGGESQQQLLQEIAASEDTLKLLLQQQIASETRHNGLREHFEAQSAALREQEGVLRLLREQVGVKRDADGTAHLRITELTMQIRHLEASMLEKHRIDLTSLPVDGDAKTFDEAAMRQRLSDLQRQVDDLGEVNLMAIEEYRDLEARHTFLSEQKTDLEESLQELQKAIQRINRTTRKRFLETFQMVNEKFRDVFPRLFCGGQAELRLTNEEDLLETGIEIIVQPPGKKLQNVSLLSGGEKALTAVALIFSIFLVKPSPFCLLDEVDAPLDDANIGRFNDMIREMTSFSQFILITHSKTTMAVADTLYGVTMEEPGVSKVVSVRLQ